MDELATLELQHTVRGRVLHRYENLGRVVGPRLETRGGLIGAVARDCFVALVPLRLPRFDRGLFLARKELCLLIAEGSTQSCGRRHTGVGGLGRWEFRALGVDGLTMDAKAGFSLS